MDELRIMLEQSYAHSSLMHRHYQKRVQELEQAYQLLREKKDDAFRKESEYLRAKSRQLVNLRVDTKKEILELMKKIEKAKNQAEEASSKKQNVINIVETFQIIKDDLLHIHNSLDHVKSEYGETNENL